MTMRIKHGGLLLLLAALAGCGEEEAKSAAAIDPCDLLSADALAAHFPGASAVEQRSSERTYPSCRSTFTTDAANYRMTLTLAPNLGSQANLERAVSVFDAASPVADLGQGAFYVDAPVHQVSVWAGEHLFHLALERDNSGDRQQALTLARQVVTQLQ